MPKDPWEPKRKIEHGYFSSLKQIVEYLSNLIINEPNPYVIAALIKAAFNNPVFKRYSESAARKMVTHLMVENAKSWREAAKKGSKGSIIHKALMQELKGPIGGAVHSQIMRNAEIISTLPLNISQKVTDYISEETFKGKRASEIAEEIKRMFPERTKASAKLIARTEVSKTSTALTRARAESIGLGWYVWRTSEDERVRSSHKHMDRVLIKWLNPPQPEKLIGEKHPPAPYHAGEIYNCRCYPAPLTDIDRVQWPHKVFYGGIIQMMTRSKFMRIM